MSKFVAAINRVFVLVWGVLFLAVGLWSIGLYLDFPLAQRLADLARPRAWGAAPEEEWFIPAVVAVGVACVVIAGSLVGANLRRHRVRRVATQATTDLGTIQLDVDSLAAAIADSFAAQPRVIRARGQVRADRGQQVMLIAVTADADANLPLLRSQAEQAEADFRAAAPGSDIALQFRLHLAPVERRLL